MRLVSAAEMREMDRITIEEIGIPGMVLMENAARGASRGFLDHFRPATGSHAVVLCGPGNNGGDGYVIARYLHNAGLRLTVLVLSKSERITGDALLNLEVIRRLGLKIYEVPGLEQWSRQKHLVETCDYVIDGILGTGLNSPVQGLYATVIEDVNAAGKRVMAIDIPSGLNADTGKIMGMAIRADLTVTFGLPKVGQAIFPGVDLVGRLLRIDIGIPQEVSDRIPARFWLTEPNEFKSWLPAQRADIHKGHRGHLLVLAGSPGKTGAAALTAMGALRAGAGLVTLGIPGSLNPILENKLTEAMTVPLPETDEGSLSLRARQPIMELLDDKTALALGPGLSTHPETAELVRDIMASCNIPLVVDADGVNAIAQKPEVLTTCGKRVVLTPHPGEMARLTGLKSAEVQEDRIGTATRFVGRHGCFLVLKGARTLIVKPSGEVFVNPTGNPALSSGGSGDVLTGVIGGFLAREWELYRAAIGGAYLHGLAADLLAQDMGDTGVLAGELLPVIPELMASLAHDVWPLQSRPPHQDLYQPL